jgi:Flp pilus assembly pilin Flp
MKRFLLDETGLELSEYAVASALVAITVVVTFGALGDAIITRIEELTSRING